MKKQIVVGILAATMIATLLTGCGSKGKDDKSNGKFDTSAKITVTSREDGSGTRGAFIELFGIEEKDADGNKVDKTIDSANFTNSTAVMMTSVAYDKNAIGYISLGSLNDSVKALKVDGTEASVENIENNSYKIARPFNIVVKDKLNAVATDFENYILSKDGQKVITDNGYIAVSDKDSFQSDNSKGKIVVAGSSSVSPVMEKLVEAYKKINTNAEIELQTSDSTTGVSSAAEGVCDIGMASRDLKDDEGDKGVTAVKIAMDGIAVVVNKANSMDNISSDAVKAIYTGETSTWKDAAK